MKSNHDFLNDTEDLLAQFEVEGHLPLDWNEELSLEDYLARLDQGK